MNKGKKNRKLIILDARLLGSEETGLGRYTHLLVEEIISLSSEYFFTVFIRKKDIGKIHKILNNNVIVLDVHPFSLANQFFLPRVLWRLKPDLVHILSYGIPLFWHGKIVITIHDLLEYKWANKLISTRSMPVHKIKLAVFRELVFRSAMRAEAIVTPTNFVARQIQTQFNFPSERIFVTHEGIDQILQPQQTFSIDKLLNKYRLRKPYILYVGTVYPYKNISVIIEAVQKIKRDIPFLSLVIVGPDSSFMRSFRKDIEQKELGKLVRILGFVPDEDLAGIYHGAFIYISAAIEEGFGLTPLEALGCGCPVVVSDIPVFREIFGKYAYYFDPHDPNSLIHQVKRFLSLPEQKRHYRVKSGIHHAQMFRWRKTAQQTLNVYKHILNGNTLNSPRINNSKSFTNSV